MATLQEIYDVRYSSGALRARVIGALLVASNDILNNASETAARKKWARATLRNPEAKIDAFLLRCALNATIAAAGDAATDNDITYVVNGAIDALNDEE